MNKIIYFVLFCLVTTGLIACSKTQQDSTAASTTKKELVFGASAMPYSTVFEQGIKPILEKQGYTIKTMNFSTLEVNNQSVNNGQVDFNLDQHTAYLNVFNREKGTHLYPLVHIPTIPAAIYSDKYTSFQQAPNGATVLIPSDPANTSRALRILTDNHFIQLKSGTNPILATSRDIVSNPKQLKIKEMDSVMIPRTLGEVDFGFASGGIAYQSKLDPKKAVLREKVIPEMEMVVTINEKNKDTQWAKDLKAAYQSPEFKQFMQKYNQNQMWALPQGE
ncbi:MULTISPECIES: MetQ/NlpA family ABC transporter substrate-binding protein [Snodgrassella]|uniref:MetQ/NlpA family ABC transporter substrate-binding protein n=1 Tax=Snodgrassella TaxID=1193515 RepID=UPI000A070712|nr:MULTISPECIES: MetQ/NlpA family ABC transporter substrate-binding protein [Snodgrassella]MBI0130609.1 metal ABC transporter substrate-binding protein [Snodgrassella sp. W8124]MBI0159793.1 metal ABC transporter substrate-binding protein [Snodgrassella sp. W6238H11]MBI0161978.1 metal ABC transporter substrate-binding protein [Snodgrassella sp. W6238H14]MBI0166294.1 metal ABC transporter substrate-binding protein [Snodgrassella sp. M0351]MBI0182539.1 metal ABC transporter substrate-binding prot